MNIDLKNKKFITIIILIIILGIILYTYFRIIYMYRNNNIFVKEALNLAEEIKNPIFKIEKILIYSDVNIEDLSIEQNLSNINISQFTDFAIYINNKLRTDELSEENTINKIYIDNIKVTKTPFGNQKIFYKSINDLCKYKQIEQDVNKIDYIVAHTNNEKENIVQANTFYTDCSEPAIMSYVNENIMKNKDISDTKEKLSLDGSILKFLNLDLKDLAYEITFTVNIENNLGEKFYCNMKMNVNLNSNEGRNLYRIYNAII